MYVNIVKKELSFTCGRGIPVLVYQITLPSCVPGYIDSFYNAVEDSFKQRVVGELLSEAVLAYDNSGDPRKRYRYTPKRAAFHCRPCGENEYELIFGYDGRIFLRERHIWKGDVIIKREKIQL